MDTFATTIKEMYRLRCIWSEDQWPLKVCKGNKLVRLELVESKNETYLDYQWKIREGKDITRTPLAYSDLFNIKSQTRGQSVIKILIEGDAGIGKTTLCITVSEDWANGELFQQFELVLLLPLRMKEVASAGSLSKLLQLLYGCGDAECELVANYVTKSRGKGVLIIADGWDELSESELQKESFLHEVLFSQKFFLVSVVVTSRPSASDSLRKHLKINRFVKVRGFSKEHIVEYIQAEFASDQEKGSHLLEQLENNPLVENICSVPLNCAIICHLSRTLEDLPTTLTELYTYIVLNVVLRNIGKLDLYGEVKVLTDFNSLPKRLQQSWWQLCEFAFESLIKRNQIVFSYEELAKYFSKDLHLDKEILCFGLMQPADLTLATGSGVSYNFLHLTFQEYLAALHLMKHPSGLALPAAAFYAASENFVMVWRFYFGIYFQEARKSGKKPDMKLIRQHMLGIKEFIDDDQLLWQCAFEARNEMVINEAIGLVMNSDNDIGIAHMAIPVSGICIDFGLPSTAQDCAAILYVIANIQECGKMKINFGNCGIRENQITTLTDALTNKYSKLKRVKELDLSDNKLTDKSICNLFQRASSVFQSLKDLNLSDNNIGAESINSITIALKQSPLSKLKYLDLSRNPLGVPGLHALENAVCNNVLNKLEWLCLEGSFTNDADINGAILSSLAEALLAHSPNLSKLNLSHNILGVPGASALARAISHQSMYNNVWKTNELNLNQTMLGDVGLKALLENLEGACYFSTLNVEGNNIHGSGILCLPDGLSLTNDLEDLYFGNNPLGLEGVIAVSKMISKSSCHLRRLRMSTCQLAEFEYSSMSCANNVTSMTVDDVGQQLCQLPQNRTITKLVLDRNNFNGKRIHILSGFIYLCPQLEYLYSSNCQINSDDLKQLLNRISKLQSTSSCRLCSKLEMWDLDHNQIDNSGFSTLIDYLPSLFPHLGCGIIGGIDIKNNFVSEEMILRVEKEMQKRQEEENLMKAKVSQIHPNLDPEDTTEDFETQWEIIVSTLYQLAIEQQQLLPRCNLKVIEETKEKDMHVDDCDSCTSLELKDYKTMIESPCKDHHDGPIPPPIYAPPLVSQDTSVHTPAEPLIMHEVVSETIAESQETHSDNNNIIIVTSPSDELVSTFHSNDNEEVKETDVNQPLVETADEESNVVKQAMTAVPFLTVDDLASVQRAVWEGRAKWYNIGLELGLTAGTLDAIQLDHPHSTEHCFRATLKEWLSRADLYPSWSGLARCLKAPPVGLGHLEEYLMADLDANKSYND